MINRTNSLIKFEIDNYINISDFAQLINDDTDPFLIAAIIGCLEGNIQLNIDKSYFTFINMYKINCTDNYKFSYVYSLIKRHRDYYDYIVKYFNLWHGNEFDYFNYDEYHKNDLNNNFFEIVSLIRDESIMAKENNDQDVINMYSNLSEYGKYYRKIELIN